MKPKELEQRLAVVRESGYYDGYSQGVEETHKAWIEASKNVKGIGPKRWSVLVATVFKALQKQSEGGGKHE